MSEYQYYRYYRVSGKTLHTYVFAVLGYLARGLGITSWTIFNYPFHVDLKNIAKLSFSWLVQPSSAKLIFALILVITPTHHSPTPRKVDLSHF